MIAFFILFNFYKYIPIMQEEKTEGLSKIELGEKFNKLFDD